MNKLMRMNKLSNKLTCIRSNSFINKKQVTYFDVQLLLCYQQMSERQLLSPRLSGISFRC